MSEDSRLGAYAPPPDDYETFDARDAEQDRRGWLFLAAAGVVFALFVAVVWNTFQLGVRERSDSPVIAADAEPYRVAPDDPGGYETPDQDLTVHELRSGEAAAGRDAEPAPARASREEPVDPPAREMPEVRIETADADELDDPAPADTAPAETEPAPAEPARTIEDVIAEREARRAAEPEAEPVEPAPASEPAAPEPAPAPAATVQGDWVAQIAAFRSEADAEAGWTSFVRRLPQLAEGRAADIQYANLGDRGVFYRLRVAGFQTREAAASYCAQLTAAGQACLVARR